MCSHVETYTQCQILFCYTDGFIYAGRDIPVSRNSLTCYTARHLRIRHLVQFILADPVYYNALTNCAARLCRACVDLITCVAERYLTMRTGCEKHGRKNPLPYSFSKRSHIGNLRRIRKQGKGRSSKRKGTRWCPFLFCPSRRCGNLPRSAERNSSLNFSEKLSARKGTNTLAQFEYPAQPVLRNAARIGRTACAVRASQRVGAGIACVAVKPPQLHINYVCVTPTYTV